MLKFAHTEYFLLLAIIIVFAILFWLYRVWNSKAKCRFGDEKVIAKLMPEVSASKPVLKFLMIIIACVFLVIGIVDPQIGSKLEKVKREGIDLYLVLDVSTSMLAEDIKPNRLERSKLAISTLIDKLQGDRVGIIIFAGNAYKQLPLTTDYSAAKIFLSAVDTEIVPTQGTAIGEAIELAALSFGDTDHNKAIIIITDGENHEGDAIEAATLANELNINVFTIGMGLPEGAPIPLYNSYGVQTGFKKDKNNTTVITKLNEDMLRQIAAAGGGAYARANNASTGLKRIFDDISAIDKKEIETRQFTDYEDRFQIFLGLSLFLLVLELLIADRKTSWVKKFDFFGK
ncbi:MAG: hypothetical protein CL661_03170 [Bacteroidetes bacterium]|jgi:Ca-activated chloride channel family protein|nr:hypothetical protein [Bacteroidota bacterium]|tara:strand:- start:1252 stop:2283 length:1032 start_codon:yes stop_codon:yes gene_type:complete